MTTFYSVGTGSFEVFDLGVSFDDPVPQVLIHGHVHSFGIGKSVLTLDHEALLDEFAKYLKRDPRLHCQIVGMGSRSYSARANEIVGRRRAANVHGYLVVKAGVSSSQLSMPISVGESYWALDVPDGTENPLHRRVEFTTFTSNPAKEMGRERARQILQRRSPNKPVLARS